VALTHITVPMSTAILRVISEEVDIFREYAFREYAHRLSHCEFLRLLDCSNERTKPKESQHVQLGFQCLAIYYWSRSRCPSKA
jgi:hypothetical protein